MTKKKMTVLDVTLRDGSYAVDFSFTPQETAHICRGLEDAGIEWIEVGHGVGLGASGPKYGVAAATDEEYMKAARKSLKKAKFGMFCIPGIATLEHLDLAKKHGMGFVRVGTNVTEVESSEPFIKKAKDLGLFVAANYMKSYALSPAQFAKQVRLSERYGVDMIYIVDSAGSMSAEDITRYFKAIRKISDIPVGFHGHDNLGLAIANSVAAADAGITFIDSSLQGLGRSAGNAATEVLITALLKRGYALPYNLFKLFELGQKFIQPRLTTLGRAPLDIIAGFAEFHSSFMPHIQEYSVKYNVDAALLILEITKVDKVSLDLNVLDKIARSLPKTRELYFQKYGFNRYAGKEQD